MKKMLFGVLLFSGAAIFLSVGSPIDSSRAADSAKLTIAYGSNVMGYLEPCG